MTSIYGYSATAASNNSAAPDGAPEGMAASGLNDTIRKVMANLAEFAIAPTAGGTADALTVTPTNAVAALVDGMIMFVRAANANATTTPTFAPSGLPAHTITKNGGSALVAGDIAGAGHVLILQYKSSGTLWELLNPKVPTAATRASLGLDTTDSPQFAAVNVGAATDTTVSRSAAGVIAVEGVELNPGIPPNSKSAAYTTVLADANECILHPAADNNARTFTIDSNANVAYPIGTTLTFVNEINTVTIAITSDTLTLASAGTTGSRTLAANGVATAIKVTTTKWYISGSGLT